MTVLIYINKIYTYICANFHDRREKEVYLGFDEFLKSCQGVYIKVMLKEWKECIRTCMHTFKSAIAPTKLEGRSEILLLFCLRAMYSSGKTWNISDDEKGICKIKHKHD